MRSGYIEIKCCACGKPRAILKTTHKNYLRNGGSAPPCRSCRDHHTIERPVKPPVAGGVRRACLQCCRVFTSSDRTNEWICPRCKKTREQRGGGLPDQYEGCW